MNIESMIALLAVVDSPRVIDGFGVYGNFLHYYLVVAFVGSALMIFLYLWKNEKLDMDEEPKIQMMQTQEESTDGE